MTNNQTMKCLTLTLLATVFINVGAGLLQDYSIKQRVRPRYLSSRNLGTTTAQCLKSLETVARVGNLADAGETQEMKCKTKSSKTKHYSVCDATGSSSADRLIELCSSAGGRDVSVVYSIKCASSSFSSKEDLTGPLCIPKRCGVYEYVEYMNSKFITLDLGEDASCENIIIPLETDPDHSIRLFYVAIVGAAAFITVAGVFLFYIRRNRVQKSIEWDSDNRMTSNEMS